MNNINNLPAALRETGLFCCWRYETRPGADKPTKVPYNPRTGGKAQSTNPATFAPLKAAEAALTQSGYNGLGVGVFGSLGAIDIDHCINEAGALSEMAQDVMQSMDTYAERSPSGRGLRLLFTIPAGFVYDKGRYYINNQKRGLEIYVAGATQKFVTVTGDTLTPGKGLEVRGGQLQEILERYMVRPRVKQTAPAQAPAETPAGLEALDDQRLIEKMRRGKSGETFARLWAGDTSGYNSHSEADIALCNILAWWTNGNLARMDRLFRSSGLMRPKWDRPQSGSTYGALTLENAAATRSGGYDPTVYFRKRAAEDFIETPAGPVTLADLAPDNNERYKPTDIGNSNLFADWYQDVARYAPERKQWFVYDGKVWRPDTGGVKAMQLCKKLADDLAIYALSLPDGASKQDYMKQISKWQSRHYRETILKDAASVHPVLLAEFDADPWLFNCRNGTLDLRTRQLRPHSPADMQSLIAGVKFDPAARSERWERFISEITQGDTERALFLQKALGYALTGTTDLECLFILYGATSRNGKGTTMETFKRLMGDYSKSAKPETIAMKPLANSAGPSEDIARLAGARFVNISEPDKKLVLSAALVKTLTGNDTITARFLHENSFEYLPQFKLFINTNYPPKITDVTLFSSGRVKLIPFDRHFEEAERDTGLKKALAQQKSLSGVLNWCLEGLWMLQETGLEMPESVQRATDAYRQRSDKMGRFVAECLVEDPDGEIPTMDAYDLYRDWCGSNGLRYESMESFKIELENHVEIKRKRPAGSGRSSNPRSMILGYKKGCVLGVC